MNATEIIAYMNRLNERGALMALSKQGRDVRLAVLVATSVEKGAANGRPRKTSANTEVFEKVSAERFGREAGTTGDRVLRHLDAWNRAADHLSFQEAVERLAGRIGYALHYEAAQDALGITERPQLRLVPEEAS